ncbi:MAG: pirin family protein [Actinoallomurus sp.]
MSGPAAAGGGPVAELFASRQVPLGGIRGMRVDRLLPHRSLRTVGGWCFLDRFGPQRADMRVLPHPHTGLQTVTWPLLGEIRHRDSLGNDVLVRPGQLNLMTAGHGVSHSEFSTGDAPLLHALQLWLALPAGREGIAPGFEQHTSLPRYESGGLRATVFIGALGEARSPATVHTPLVGADLDLAAGTAARLPLRADFEHALLVVEGEVSVAGTPLGAGPLLHLGAGRDELAVSAAASARAVLIGGEPFADDLVMWWNFVGRDHEDIAAARAAWEEGDRFGRVAGHGSERVPAPALPGVRLRPRS